jgi:hypothetical protein
MMPTKTSVGPNEVVRLEVLRLAPPLLFAGDRRATRAGVGEELVGAPIEAPSPLLQRDGALRCVTRGALGELLAEHVASE